MSATFDYHIRTGIRCEIHGCRNKAAFYIGHTTHRHTGFYVCKQCGDEIYADWAALKGEATTALEQKQVEFKQHQMEAKQKKLYWNDRSKKARLLYVAKELRIDTRNGSNDDGHMTRVEIIAELRKIIPECEKTGTFE